MSDLARARGSAPSPISSTLQTFLIADVRGYTRFTAENGDGAAARLASRFAALAEEVVAHHGGRVVELRGDEALCSFPSARDALRAALALRAAFREATELDPSLPLPVGMGLDAGEAIPVEG
ncbi:MAG: adenylate/guanylate cyclase domain-containing protein, partial [Chloroflexi bacterium]|nr:adenylate/guanylate cyclase domain-containing protein [Chloroflexota bacterium]